MFKSSDFIFRAPSLGAALRQAGVRGEYNLIREQKIDLPRRRERIEVRANGSSSSSDSSAPYQQSFRRWQRDQ